MENYKPPATSPLAGTKDQTDRQASKRKAPAAEHGERPDATRGRLQGSYPTNTTEEELKEAKRQGLLKFEYLIDPRGTCIAFPALIPSASRITMSSSTSMEHDWHPTAMETEIQKKRQIDAKESLCVGHFYMTNAGFPKELDLSKHEYNKSPLRSFQALPPLGPPISERELLRVSTNTTFKHEKPNGDKTRGKKQYNYRRPCYLVEYDKSTNQGVIFLGTSKEPKNPHRFAIVHSRGTTGPLKETIPLKPGSLGTKPAKSFKKEETYLNFSHPLRVRFAYFVNDQMDIGEIPSDGRKPPFVGIANYITQIPDFGPPVFTFPLDQVSEDLFWRKHKEYHRSRPGQLVSKDDSGGDGPDDGGSSSGGTGPSSGGAGPSSGGAGPSSGGAGPGSGGAGPGSGGAGPSSGGAGPSSGGAGPGSGGAGPSSGGAGFSGVGFSSCEVEDAPWGRVGDQRIGIDVSLVTEDIHSDSDEEMDSEGLVINLDANDAPWGRVGDQRIGIDIPLVTEDIYSDSDEEMDLESDEELQEVGDVANVDKPESSDQKGITTRPNPSDKDSSFSYAIPKPYFMIVMPFMNQYALLDQDQSTGEWRWMVNAYKSRHMVVSTEGLSYEFPFYRGGGHDYLDEDEQARKIFNWHTKECTVLPPPPKEHDILSDLIVGMIVDTSAWPYAFKVIESTSEDTMIYDLTTHSWAHQPSTRAFFYCNRFSGNANVASCKGIAFMVDNKDQIVFYDAKKDKWGRIKGPRGPHKELRGIGSWGDRIFSCTVCISENGMTIEIQELVDMAKTEWKEFDVMPGGMCSWLKSGLEDSYHYLNFEVSFCSENLLIWAHAGYAADFNSWIKRPVLYNLAHKTWVKLNLPLLPSPDHLSRMIELEEDKFMEEIMGQGQGT